mgnify:CR=1 FL=1
MVSYECQRCGYETTNKSMFKRHLLRKNLCNLKFCLLNRYQLLIANNFHEEAKEYAHEAQCKPKVKHTVIPIPQDVIPNGITCKFCKKVFSTRQGKYKHLKYHCKKKIDESEKDIIIKELKEKNEELSSMIEKLLDKSNNINIVEGAINTTNNIQINNYGSENIEYLSDKVFKKLLDKPFSAITKLIELKHFNPNHPENHNVKITNIHDKYAKIYQDKVWLIKHKRDVVEELVENGYADFEEFKDLNEDELAEKIKEKYKLMQRNYNDNFEKICEKSEIVVYNKSKNIVV